VRNGKGIKAVYKSQGFGDLTIQRCDIEGEPTAIEQSGTAVGHDWPFRCVTTSGAAAAKLYEPQPFDIRVR
jgi:hypothetical protein